MKHKEPPKVLTPDEKIWEARAPNVVMASFVILIIIMFNLLYLKLTNRALTTKNSGPQHRNNSGLMELKNGNPL